MNNISELPNIEIEKEIARRFSNYTEEEIELFAFAGVGINYTTSWYYLMPIAIENRIVIDFERDCVFTVLGSIIEFDFENKTPQRTVCELLLEVTNE